MRYYGQAILLPNGDVIERILTSGEHVKKLARHYLQNLKHEGVTILEQL